MMGNEEIKKANRKALLKIVFRQMHLITQKKTLLSLKDWQKHTLP